MDTHAISRRNALKVAAVMGASTMGASKSALAADLPVAAKGDFGSPAAGNSASSSPAMVLSAYQCDKNIWVRINDELFCCYRANDDQKYPYIYPLVGPSTGLSMTEESSVPWPHHRSMFFGCDRVNGGNYWQDVLARGQIISQGPKVESTADDRVIIADVCDWRSGEGQNIMEDRRSIRITAPDATTRVLDCRLQWTAQTDIEIAKTNHSLFSIRAARGLTPLGGGKLINSAGDCEEKGTFGKPAAWCGFEGTRMGRTESIVLMDGASNPWYPCRWFTRDYGFASPTPFFFIDDKEPWRLPAGKKVDLAYQVVIVGGPIDPARMDRLAASFKQA